MVETLTGTTLEERPAWSAADLPDLQALAALDLPDSDGEPMENDRERIQINLALE